MEKKESEDNIPSDFFDDFAKDDFIKGLSVIDSWGDDNEKKGLDKGGSENISAVENSQGKCTIEPNKPKEQVRRKEHYVSIGKRRDPAKTILAIKKDKELKVKQMLTKCLESNADLKPPGTELDEFYEHNNEDVTTKKRQKSSNESKCHEREISHSNRSLKRESCHRGRLPKNSPRRHDPHKSSRLSDSHSSHHDHQKSLKHYHYSQSKRSRSPIWLIPFERSPLNSRAPKLSRSPRRRSRSPMKRLSPRRQTSFSPHQRHSRSPHRRQHSPYQRQSHSYRQQSDSPHRPQPSSLHRRRSRSPLRRRSRSSHRRRSRSSHRRRSRSSRRRQTRSPHRRASISPPHQTSLDYIYSSQQQAANYTTNPYLNTTPVPGYTYPPAESTPYSGIYSFDYQSPDQSSLVPVPVPAPVPAPIPAQNSPLKLANQYSNLNVAPDGSISHINAPKGGSVEGWSMDLTSKVELLARCHDAVSNLSRLHLPNRLVILNENMPPDPKPLTSRYCSPLKRQPIISFNFTNVSGKTDQNKQLVDAITATVGLDSYVVKPQEKSRTTADKGVQTSTPFCQVCEIRDNIVFKNVETKIDASHFCSSVESQVIDNELLNSKSIYKSAGGISDGAPVSICHLTPAQLVSQLAARAKTFKRNDNTSQSDDYRHGMGSNQNYNFSNKFQKY